MRRAMGSSSSSSPKSSSDTEELHVLAVDDSVIDRKFIEKLLRNSAYKVTTVESGTRALEILGLGEQGSSPPTEDLKVNLIITDYCMPGMNGYELLKRVKECSAMREIPVVVMSSENIPTRIYRCLEGGAQEFMLKPLNQSDVKRLRSLVTKFKKGCKGMFSGGTGR